MLAAVTQPLRLKKYQNDIKKKDAILASTYFQNPSHIFQRDAKFVLTDQVAKVNSIEELNFILKKEENILILDLYTLCPDGLNQELEDV